MWGEHVHSARYYRGVTVFLGLVVILLPFPFSIVVTRPDPLPVVVRVDEVGRALVVDYHAGRATADINDPVVPYFLTQFIYDHYSRRRVIAPRIAPLSLLPAAGRSAGGGGARLPGFIDFHSDDGAPSRSSNVQLRLVPPPEPPWAAAMVFDIVGQIYCAETSRTSMVVSLRFVFAEAVGPESLLINPMGLVIVYLDQ